MAEYIEREAAVKLAQESYEQLNLAMAAADGAREINRLYKLQELCKTVEEVFKKVPAADVAPVRHGRWILEPTNPYDDPGYKNRMIKVCSCCHWSNACKYNYCPNCGAKMDQETEE